MESEEQSVYVTFYDVANVATWCAHEEKHVTSFEQRGHGQHARL